MISCRKCGTDLPSPWDGKARLCLKCRQPTNISQIPVRSRDSVEQLVPEYENLMRVLLEKVETDLLEYVRDIATATWNDAIAHAGFEIRTHCPKQNTEVDTLGGVARLLKDVADEAERARL